MENANRRAGTDLGSFYRSLLERTFDLVLVVNDEGRVTFCNHASTAFLGYLPEGLVGQAVLDLAHLEDRDRVARMLNGTSPSAVFPFRLRHADGTWRLVEAQTSRALDVDGSRVTAIVARDITIDHQLESDRQRDARLASLARMTAEAAHDITNILHAMSVHVEMLAAEPQTGRLDTTAPLTRAIQTATEVTAQLLAFARGTAEPAHDDGAETDAHAVINRSRLLLRTLARRSTRLTLRLDAHAPQVGLASGELMQVLVNLVTNARDAMPGGGELTIATSNVTVGCRDKRVQFPRGAFALEIVDTGCGMPVNVKARIFDPYFTTKPAGQGSGLGLPAVLAIVRRAHGCIEVDSTSGQGTTVRVLLPAVGTAAMTLGTSAA